MASRGALCRFHDQIIQSHRHLIQQKIDPEMILDYMGDKICEIDRQRVRQQCRNWGKIVGSRELMDVLLRSCSDAFVTFVKAVTLAGAGDGGVMLARSLIEKVPKTFQFKFSGILPNELITDSSVACAGQEPQNENRLLEDIPMEIVEVLREILKQKENWKKMVENVAKEDIQRIKDSADPVDELLSLFKDYGWTSERFVHQIQELLPPDTCQIVSAVLGVNQRMDAPLNNLHESGSPDDPGVRQHELTIHFRPPCELTSKQPEIEPRLEVEKYALSPTLPMCEESSRNLACKSCGKTPVAIEDVPVSKEGNFIYRTDSENKFLKRLHEAWLAAIENAMAGIIEDKLRYPSSELNSVNVKRDRHITALGQSRVEQTEDDQSDGDDTDDAGGDDNADDDDDCDGEGDIEEQLHEGLREIANATRAAKSAAKSLKRSFSNLLDKL